MANFFDNVQAIREWVKHVGPTRAARMAGLAIGTVKVAMSTRGNPTVETLRALDDARASHMQRMSSRPPVGASPQT